MDYAKVSMYKMNSNKVYGNGRALSVRLFLCFVFIWVSGCATESHKAVVSEKAESYGSAYSGSRASMIVGRFQNQSSYMQGLFSSNIDRLGNQAETILIKLLNNTNAVASLIHAIKTRVLKTL
ncbi:MAG: hypothetical protein A6F72_05180 [Cycloclasticus sp. symbiont of Poecilosclerida sp. N]|nr:MAG: hypothetical protein A6F72_05180 [Cycloclasticus sp. symbiont of Poecilosclerida sp. N]